MLFRSGQTAFLMLRNHGEKRSHHTIKGGVILLYGHLILLKVMKSLHQCEQKSTIILNILPLQIAPHLLSRITVQTRAHPEQSTHHQSRADGKHQPTVTWRCDGGALAARCKCGVAQGGRQRERPRGGAARSREHEVRHGRWRRHRRAGTGGAAVF